MKILTPTCDSILTFACHLKSDKDNAYYKFFYKISSSISVATEGGTFLLDFTFTLTYVT